MSRAPQTPIFVQRSNYRQRRLRDAARMVVYLGLVLWMVPLLWPTEMADNATQSRTLVYIFCVWVLLVALAAGLSHRVWMAPKSGPSESDDR